ncbi:hypothetical protein Tco_1012091, partial [Tanacetum coccineum]
IKNLEEKVISLAHALAVREATSVKSEIPTPDRSNPFKQECTMKLEPPLETPIHKVETFAKKHTTVSNALEDLGQTYKSPACLLFEQCTRSCDNESIDTLDSVDNMQKLEVKHEDMIGYDVVYGKGENEMLEQWMCFRDHERQRVDRNRMIIIDFLKVRYGNKTIDDATRERLWKNAYALDDVWEKCEKFHGGTLYPWHDEGFEEEEQWESGIEKIKYEPPSVNIETFEIKRFSQQGNGIRGRIQALEQEMRDLDVEHKQMKMLKASYGVTTPQELCRNQD